MTLSEAYEALKDSEDPAVQVMLKAAMIQLYALDRVADTTQWARENLDALEEA